MKLAILLFVLVGCSGLRNDLSHMKSNWVGLKRHVTFYASDGKVIKEWSIQGTIEDNGGTIRFLTDDGKAITLGGPFLVEEQ